uniref:Uncharacterized protein n=1 Tax=viral metagenome TaxID=1070528 RepID=A0A6C0BLB7_9ZZZZ
MVLFIIAEYGGCPLELKSSYILEELNPMINLGRELYLSSLKTVINRLPPDINMRISPSYGKSIGVRIDGNLIDISRTLNELRHVSLKYFDVSSSCGCIVLTLNVVLADVRSSDNLDAIFRLISGKDIHRHISLRRRVHPSILGSIATSPKSFNSRTLDRIREITPDVSHIIKYSRDMDRLLNQYSGYPIDLIINSMESIQLWRNTVHITYCNPCIETIQDIFKNRGIIFTKLVQKWNCSNNREVHLSWDGQGDIDRVINDITQIIYSGLSCSMTLGLDQSINRP